MGQRSQIFVVLNDGKEKPVLIARYFQWNYGHAMVSRASATIQWIKYYLEQGYFDLLISHYLNSLVRIIDTNFDCLDVTISSDILEWWKENKRTMFGGDDFKIIDNNNGALFINVTDKKITYAFTSGWESTQGENWEKPLTAKQYLKYDSPHILSTKSASYDPEIAKFTRKNFRQINKCAELMTRDELEQFIETIYEI